MFLGGSFCIRRLQQQPTHMQTHIHVHVHTYIYTQTHTHTCSCAHTQPNTHVSAQAERLEEEASEQALMLSRVLTLQDPFQGFPFTTTPGVCACVGWWWCWGWGCIVCVGVGCVWVVVGGVACAATVSL